MNKFLLTPLFALSCALVAPAYAAQQNLDQLLSSIKSDIAAKRLSTPVGNNAQERIEIFREQAPYDYRILPLAYEWGKANVALANNAIAQKNYNQAQQYLDRVWFLAPLTAGLEAAQDNLDKLHSSAPQVAEKAAPSQSDLERQKKVAEQAAKEKARVEAEQKRQEAEKVRQAELAKQKAAEDLAKRQEQERQRRLAAEQAAKKTATTPAKTAPVSAVAAPAVVAAVSETANDHMLSAKEAKELWSQAEEDSAPIASYPLPAEPLTKRDRDAIAKALQPICKAIVDNKASIVVHTQDKGDYRWLAVRLTLCLRPLDKDFRLRHSHQADTTDDEPFITLHPARSASLLRAEAGE